MFRWKYFCRIAHCRKIIRNIFCYNSICSNQNFIPNMNISDNLSTCPNINIIPYYRCKYIFFIYTLYCRYFLSL